MTRRDAGKEIFEEILLFGNPALFHGLRMDYDTVPKGLFVYEVRHGGFAGATPVQVGRHTIVNYMGTVITAKPLPIPLSGYLDIDSERDWKYVGMYINIVDFQKRYSRRCC